jgi:hypothetical protein
MSFSRETTAWCDRCGNWERVSTGSIVNTKKLLRGRNWMFRKNEALCPNCAENERTTNQKSEGKYENGV